MSEVVRAALVGRRRRRDAQPRAGARRHGRGHGRRGHAGPARRAAGRASDARRDGRRAGGLRDRDAGARAAGRGARWRHRHRRDGRRQERHVQHLDRGGHRRGRRRRAGRQARQPRRHVRARAPPTSSTRWASSIQQSPDEAAESLREDGFAFLFAPGFHPAMRHAGPTRRELGVRTAFNLIGPMTNPAGVARLVVGAGDADGGAEDGGRAPAPGHRARLRGPRRGHRRAAARRQRRALRRDARRGHAARDRAASPSAWPRAPRAALAGGTPAENAGIVEAVLRGARGTASRRRAAQRRRRPGWPVARRRLARAWRWPPRPSTRAPPRDLLERLRARGPGRGGTRGGGSGHGGRPAR